MWQFRHLLIMRRYSLPPKMTSIFLSTPQREISTIAFQTAFAMMILSQKLFSSVCESNVSLINSVKALKEETGKEHGLFYSSEC